ncbi:MAG: lysylphosphatidylglycerol synthase domain-containing protein [Phycisphaerales bacterium JB065]
MNTPSQRAVRIRGAFLGLLLLAAAVAAIVSRRSATERVSDAFLNAPTWMFMALALSVAITPLLTAAVFWILTRRYGRVGFGEMGSLILAAWLLNYLPLWPGMFSRVAYHRLVNGIPVRDSARVIVQAGAVSGIAAGLVGVLVLAVALPLGITGWSAATVGVSGGMICAALALVTCRSAKMPHMWRYFGTTAVRTLELSVWALRYALAVRIVGGEVSADGALTIAALVQIAVLLPIAPNGIGVREWAVGIAASGFAIGIAAETGLAAGLLDRGMEVLVAVPLGLMAAGWLARRRKQLGVEISADPNAA